MRLTICFTGKLLVINACLTPPAWKIHQDPQLVSDRQCCSEADLPSDPQLRVDAGTSENGLLDALAQMRLWLPGEFLSFVAASEQVGLEDLGRRPEAQALARRGVQACAEGAQFPL